MLRYSELTAEQKEFICNGCGGKGGVVNPPEFIFHDSCNQHDFYYWRGCSEKDRKLADKAFYQFMKVAVSQKPWYLRPHFYFWAFSYYQAVRLSGKKFFYYGERMKTIEDLYNEMNQGV